MNSPGCGVVLPCEYLSGVITGLPAWLLGLLLTNLGLMPKYIDSGPAVSATFAGLLGLQIVTFVACLRVRKRIMAARRGGEFVAATLDSQHRSELDHATLERA